MQAYTAPTITEVGTVREMTLAGGRWETFDNETFFGAVATS